LEGLTPDRFQRWKSNYNADLYLTFWQGRQVVLKILVSKPAATLDMEYASLQELHRIAQREPTFRVAAPVLHLPGRSAYVAEWMAGQPLAAQIGAWRSPGAALQEASRQCGRALSTIHRAWGMGQRMVPIWDILEDFQQHCPWPLSPEERRLLVQLGKQVEHRYTRFARLYLDFDPVNVLMGQGLPGLLDPPEACLRGPVHWDLGVFTLGLQRSHWRHPGTFLWPRREPWKGLCQAFLQSYAAHTGSSLQLLDHLLITLFETIRLAQLWMWWMTPSQFRYRRSGILRALYAYPLLQQARRHQFRKLKSLLR